MPAAVEVDGRPATEAQLLAAMSSYGHFTAMQVRDGRVRGLDRHLVRLDEATRLLFGRALDTDRVRAHLRHAVAGRGSVSVRVLVHAAPLDEGMVNFGEPTITITVGDPQEPSFSPLRMRSVRYERDLPSIKHLGGFGLGYHFRAANLAGFDDAVFVDGAGRLSEASIWNIGFRQNETIVWPSAPMLSGITRQLLGEGLAKLGIPTATREIGLADLPDYDCAFVLNSQNPGRPIASIDDTDFAVEDDLVALLVHAYEVTARQEI